MSYHVKWIDNDMTVGKKVVDYSMLGETIANLIANNCVIIQVEPI